jgi:hypothetical protein
MPRHVRLVHLPEIEWLYYRFLAATGKLPPGLHRGTSRPGRQRAAAGPAGTSRALTSLACLADRGADPGGELGGQVTDGVQPGLGVRRGEQPLHER